MRQQEQALTFPRVRGRNGFDPPLALGEGFALEVLNCDFWEGEMGRKRGGSAAVSLTFSAGGPFTGHLSALIRHVPGSDPTAAELWAIDNAATPIWGRLAGGTTWAAVTVADAISTRPQDLMGVSLNGKLYVAYDSAENRLHLWDGTTFRRVGVGTPSAPTVADTGAGTYAADLRFYKVAMTVQVAGVTVRRSELSTSVSFTPSGTGTAARVTKPTTIEDATHWELYGAELDAGPYYRIATTAVGTTTYDDSALPSSYSTNPLEPVAGSNLPPPSAKFLATHNTRLLLFGSWETSGGFVTPKNDRVWFTEPLGSSDVGDDERIPITDTASNYLDLGENDSGIPTGLKGPFQDAIYAFKLQSIIKLVPTGEDAAPYRPVVISRSIGAIRQHAIVEGEDELGNPALYFLALDGPRRLGRNGIEWLGYDVQDLWDTVNLDASTVVAHGLYHRAKKQVWWWIATGSSNTPDRMIVFDVTEGKFSVDGTRLGWVTYTGTLAAARCAVLFSTTIGASMSRDVSPYAGGTSANKLLKADTSDTSDDGTAYQAYFDLAPQVAEVPHLLRVTSGYLLAAAGSLVTLRVTLTRDFGVETRTVDVALAPAASETRVWPRLEAVAMAGATALAVRIGDAAAVANTWTVDRLVLGLERRQER